MITCSTGYTGSIHMNTLRADTHTYIHTHIVDKSNLKKPVAHWPFSQCVPCLKITQFRSTSLLLPNAKSFGNILCIVNIILIYVSQSLFSVIRNCLRDKRPIMDNHVELYICNQ